MLEFVRTPTEDYVILDGVKMSNKELQEKMINIVIGTDSTTEDATRTDREGEQLNEVG